MINKFAFSRHINQQVNQAHDDVKKETTLESQLNQLLRQFPRASIDQSYLSKSEDVSSEDYEEEVTKRKKESLIRAQRGSISDEDTSPEVVYGKLVFYPSSMPVDPTHRSSTEVESALLTQFLPSIANEWKETTTTTTPSRSDLSNKKRRKNRKTDTNKSAKEEKLLETVIQLAEKYGADAKLGDMLKKLCENSTVTCKGVDNPKELQENKKNRRKQNSKQQINGKANRRKKPKSKARKNQIIQPSSPEESEPKWNKSIKVKNNVRKNTKSNDVVSVRQKGKIGTYSRSTRQLLPGIDKPISKSWRHPLKNNVVSTMAPPEDLERELIDLEDKTEKVNRRLRDHWAIKNKSRERLQRHIEQQIELHRRIRRQLVN